MEKVTVEELNALVKQIFEKRVEKDAKEDELTGINKQLTELKQKVVTYLKELNQELYSTPWGTVSRKRVWSVTLPKTDQDKLAFFAHLRERGIFEKFASVNYQSLQSLFKSDWEAAKKRGEGMSFKMPGIGDPTLFEDLAVRKSNRDDPE